MSYSYHVRKSFFQKFYVDRILKVKNADISCLQDLDLGVLKFWFSVIDFYGGIYYVGKEGKEQTKKRKNKEYFTLTTGESFSNFFKAFFPKPECDYGKFIYSVFRSGVVHQLSPKRSGVCWDIRSEDLIWIEVNADNSDPNDNKVAFINIKRLQDLTYQAFCNFYEFVKNPENENFCKNIYDKLINVGDIFKDGKELNAAYKKLKDDRVEIKIINKSST